MSSRLVVLITGANQGLGFETARHLSKLDHLHIFITARNGDRLKEAKETLEKEPGFAAKLDALVLDVTDDASISRAVEAVKDSAEKLDVLVNNSGIAIGGNHGDTGGLSLREAFQATYNVNVFGAAVTADAFLPLLKKSTSPRILNISSILGSKTYESDPNHPNSKVQIQIYNSSKSALNAITVNLGMVHPDIHVVSLCPGYNATNLNGYAGAMHPKEGSKIIVEHVLEKKGKSTGYYDRNGEIPW